MSPIAEVRVLLFQLPDLCMNRCALMSESLYFGCFGSGPIKKTLPNSGDQFRVQMSTYLSCHDEHLSQYATSKQTHPSPEVAGEPENLIELPRFSSDGLIARPNRF